MAGFSFAFGVFAVFFVRSRVHGPLWLLAVLVMLVSSSSVRVASFLPASCPSAGPLGALVSLDLLAHSASTPFVGAAVDLVLSAASFCVLVRSGAGVPSAADCERTAATFRSAGAYLRAVSDARGGAYSSFVDDAVQLYRDLGLEGGAE